MRCSAWLVLWIAVVVAVVVVAAAEDVDDYYEEGQLEVEDYSGDYEYNYESYNYDEENGLEGEASGDGYEGDEERLIDVVPKMISVPLAIEANVGDTVEFPCEAEVRKNFFLRSLLIQRRQEVPIRQALCIFPYIFSPAFPCDILCL